MNKSDLIYCDVVEARNGKTYLFNYCNCCNKGLFVPLDGVESISLDSYNDDLTYNTDNKEYNQYDIVKVYKDYTLKEVLWEIKEKPKLTDDEKAILRNIDKAFKYIARDKDGMLFVFTGKPFKGECIWSAANGGLTSLRIFKHLFQFIKWGDKEPYNIEDLLKGE